MSNKYRIVLGRLSSLNDLTTSVANLETKKEFPDLTFRKMVTSLINELSESEIRDSLTTINDVYHKLYSNKSTLDVLLCSDIRKPIMNRFGRYSPMHELSKEQVKISYLDKGSLIESAKQKVSLKNSDRIQFSEKSVLALVNQLITSEDPYSRAVALLISSGSRPIELFSKSGYSIVPEILGYIEQSNLAKKRDQSVSVIKPLLVIKPSAFVEAVKSIRSEIPDILDSNKLRANITLRCNKVMKKHFEDPRITLYSCRAFYAVLSYSKHSKDGVYGKDPSITLWFSKILGHQNNDLTTCSNYLNYVAI